MSEYRPQIYHTALSSGKRIGYYIDTLPQKEGDCDHISVCIPADDLADAEKLSHDGYCFVERRIAFEISLRNYRTAMPLGKKFRISVETQWRSEDIFAVAKDSFEKDCRFALDVKRKDTQLKNELLFRYIQELQEQNVQATCLYQGESLEGFNLWVMNGAVGQILLGAISAQYRGTGVALALYSHTASEIKQLCPDGAMRNIIASSNTASLNLHAMLARSAGGAFRLGPCWDYFSKDQNNVSEE